MISNKLRSKIAWPLRKNNSHEFLLVWRYHATVSKRSPHIPPIKVPCIFSIVMSTSTSVLFVFFGDQSHQTTHCCATHLSTGGSCLFWPSPGTSAFSQATPSTESIGSTIVPLLIETSCFSIDPALMGSLLLKVLHVTFAYGRALWSVPRK